MTAQPASREPGVVDAAVIISADSEWRAACSWMGVEASETTPYGQLFFHITGGARIVFVQGGWGKVSAAASAQYVFDRWRPKVLINLGTCGGFAGSTVRGEILLVEQTLLYDIYERMLDPHAAVDYYRTRLDLSWLPERAPIAIRRVCLPSADQDLDPEKIQHLRRDFGAVAVDWESGAIAWVAARNQVRCLILRGVSDLVGPDGGEAYHGDGAAFHSGAKDVMAKLLGSLDSWLRLALTAR